MIIELLNFFFILCFQLVLCKLSKRLLRHDLGPFSPIMWMLRYVGVLVHEISHFVFCLLVGVKPTRISVRFRDEKTGRPNPHGVVSHLRTRTLFQNMIISLAPIIVSMILLYWSLTIAFSEGVHWLHWWLVVLFCGALFLGGSPSNYDLKTIGKKFLELPAYSIYQIVLLASSITLAWYLCDFYQWTCPINFSTYINVEFFAQLLQEYFSFVLIPVFYFSLKFGFKGLHDLYHLILLRSVKIAPKVRYKTYTRKRFKPKKPHKLGIREAPW